MKFFTPSHSNFFSVNQNNINYMRYLKHVWNVKIFYGTYIKGKYVPVAKTSHKPSLLTHNVGLQDVFNDKVTRKNINMQPRISFRDLVKKIRVTGLSRGQATGAVNTQDIATQISVPGVCHHPVSTQDIAIQNSGPGVLNSKDFAKATGENSVRKTQDVATQMSIPASIQYDAHDVHPNDQVPRYQMNAMNPTQPYDYTIQRDEIIQRHANLPLLNPQEFQFLNLLGTGSKGSVYLAVRDNTGLAAVKTYHSEYSTKLQKDIMNEAAILSILQDTGFVPKVYGFINDPSNTRKLMLAQQFFGNGRTLWSILSGRDPNVVLNTITKINIAYQLVYALKAIHDKDVLMNDIKSNNVLVDTSTPDFRIRYIDFDLATFQGSFRYSVQRQRGNAFAAICGGQEFSWLAPEARMGGPTTPQSDIYSVGFLMSELQCPELQEVVFLCTQEKPYHRPNLDVILNMIELIMSVI